MFHFKSPVSSPRHAKGYKVISGCGKFTKKCYQVLSKGNGNILFSPLSLHSVLSMAYLGSSGSTYEAFKNTLHVPKAEQTAEEYKHILTALNSVEHVAVLTANKIYIMQGNEFSVSFRKRISEQYLSELQAVNFVENVNTATTINQWVEERTENKIKDLIKPNDLDGNTGLVLVNGIYFKCEWVHKFDREETATQTFYITEDDKVDVQMMQIECVSLNYKYNKALYADIFELPYADSDYSMLIILPTLDEINKFERKIANIELHKLMEGMRIKPINLYLPKFEIEKNIDLKNILTELGLGIIFDPGSANFSGMLSTQSDLHVSKAVQKIFIDVNENGTGTVASTAVPMSYKGRCSDSIQVMVDRPFLFQIIKKDPSMILFQGRVNFKKDCFCKFHFKSSVDVQPHKETAVISGCGQFTNNFYQVLAKKNGNILFSPYSLHTVLSMAYLGSAGSTYEAFKKVLHMPKAEQTAEEYKHIITALNSVKHVKLLTAYKVYIMNGCEFSDNFRKGISEQYLSELEAVNFADNVNAAKIINQWVEEKTNDKINNLIQSDDLDGDTRLVLVNAIYFKGDWVHKFDRESTRTLPFYINKHDTVDVEMMAVDTIFNYRHSKGLDSEILELPYADSDISMLIVLPKERDGINKLEQKITNTELHKLTKGLQIRPTTLYLPKFKIEKTIDLQNSLTELGLGIIFDAVHANFSEMLSTQSDLNVSKAIHKTVIEVNEEGTEAAASGAMIIHYKCAYLNQVTMMADHPFLFQIINKDCSLILFQGRVAFNSEE